MRKTGCKFLNYVNELYHDFSWPSVWNWKRNYHDCMPFVNYEWKWGVGRKEKERNCEENNEPLKALEEEFMQQKKKKNIKN